jgi:hypothetical protein
MSRIADYGEAYRQRNEAQSWAEGVAEMILSRGQRSDFSCMVKVAICSNYFSAFPRMSPLPMSMANQKSPFEMGLF